MSAAQFHSCADAMNDGDIRKLMYAEAEIKEPDQFDKVVGCDEATALACKSLGHASSAACCGFRPLMPLRR